jgi:hypothetical protein
VQARSWNILKIKGIELSLAFYGQKLHVTKNASQWLFEGYEDPIINVAKEIASFLGVGDIPFDRFGWFYKVSLFMSNGKIRTGSQISAKRLEPFDGRFQCEHW